MIKLTHESGGSVYYASGAIQSIAPLTGGGSSVETAGGSLWVKEDPDEVMRLIAAHEAKGGQGIPAKTVQMAAALADGLPGSWFDEPEGVAAAVDPPWPTDEQLSEAWQALSRSSSGTHGGEGRVKAAGRRVADPLAALLVLAERHDVTIRQEFDGAGEMIEGAYEVLLGNNEEPFIRGDAQEISDRLAEVKGGAA